MKVLVTGVSGQDGSYLAEQLLAEGHDVTGLVRRRFDTTLKLRVGDLLDQTSLEAALTAVQPDVVYNLAAVTAPGQGWGTAQPPFLADVTGVGVVRLLDAMVHCAPNARLVHASSSAVFDPNRYGLYGIAKQFAHDAVVGYRSHLWASNAILYSHSSPRQDPRFLVRRICSTAARIACGSAERLVLGDVDSRRDWGYAPDYMRAFQVIARQSEPGDWTIATGVPHTVRDLVESALKFVGLSWDDAVTIDPALPRVPDELLPTGPSAQDLGWSPSTTLDDMIRELTR